MSNIAIVKLVKDMFGKIFGAEEKNEKVTFLGNVTESDTSIETVEKEVSQNAKKVPAMKKAAVKKKVVTAKKKEPASDKTSIAKKKVSSTQKKPIAKKPIVKKTTEKKKTNTATKATPKGTKKAEKIALYTKAFKKQYGDVDADFLEIIVKNLGPSIYKKDAELVSCSDPKELDTVRKNFLIKKLGLKEDKEILDAAIKEVCEELKDSSKKYRVLFYYRLAQKFKKETVLS